MSSLRRIGAVSAKEFKQLSRDRVSFGMIVMIPLLQLIVFGYAISTIVRHIPIAVVDDSGSAAARTITEQVRVTQVVDIVGHYATAAEAEAAIVAGTVRAALVSVRGVGSFYHYNAIQSWKVASDGSILNVQV